MARIGFVQSRPSFGEPESNRERLLAQARRVEADLIVLPELCHSGYVFRSAQELERLAEPIPDGPTSRALLALARLKRAVLVAGICERDGDRFYNSAAILGPEGLLGVYRKLHLFKNEKLWFSRGEGPLRVFTAGGLKIGVMICFDWRFPEATRVLALAGAEVIAHPSNLVLPHCQEVMRARCIENRIFAVTANRVGEERRPDGEGEVFTGQSQVVDPDGRVLVRASVDGEEEASVDVEISEARRKLINEQNDVLADRRPEFYSSLTGASSQKRTTSTPGGGSKRKCSSGSRGLRSI
jgi:predicted amidohydrolase